MLTQNTSIYDYLSITIHSDKLPILSVLKINYEQTFNHKMEPEGLGIPFKAFSPRGVARGKFEGKFNMDMYKDDWDLLKSMYCFDPLGVFTINPTTLIVTYKDQDGLRVRTIEIIKTIFKSEKRQGMDSEGGKAITVQIEGILLEPVKVMRDGIPINGFMPI